jgi:hypothetical protein
MALTFSLSLLLHRPSQRLNLLLLVLQDYKWLNLGMYEGVFQALGVVESVRSYAVEAGTLHHKQL